MKVLFGLIVVIGIILGAVYLLGGFSSLSPAEQAAQLRQTAQPGATWQTVADFKPPKRFQAFSSTSDTGLSPTIKFDRAGFEATFNQGGYNEGFMFQYVFSSDDAFQIVFDGQGKVQGIESMPTTNDLLQGNLYTR